MRKAFFYIQNWFLALAPVILFLLPVDFFDNGKTSICLSKLLANVECYACGLTRGIMHFIHFDFSAAWSYNKLTFIVVPLLIPLWFKSIYELREKELPPFWKKIM